MEKYLKTRQINSSSLLFGRNQLRCFLPNPLPCLILPRYLLLIFTLLLNSSLALAFDKKAAKKADSLQLRSLLACIYELEKSLKPDQLAICQQQWLPLSPRLASEQAQKLNSLFTESATSFTATQLSLLKTALIEAFAIDSSPALPPDLQAAKTAYQKHCAGCHGQRGDGKGVISEQLPLKATDFTATSFAQKSSPLMIFNRLIFTKPASPMPVFEEQLSKAELWSLSFYVQGLSWQGKMPAQALEPKQIPPSLSYRLLACQHDDALRELMAKGVLSHPPQLSGEQFLAWLRLWLPYQKTLPRH